MPIAVAGVLLLALGGSGPVSGRAARAGHSIRATEAGHSVRATEAGRASALAARAVEGSTLSFLPDAGPGFVARGPGYGIAVAPDEVWVAGPSSPAPVRMRLVGARPDAAGRGELPRPGRTNLFLGEDPATWRTGVASYGRVTYAGVWDGIDVVYHGRGSELEQDFVVAPGADPAAISMSFAGSRGLRLDHNGDLVVSLTGGEVRLGRPTLYQEVDGRRRPVPGAFALLGDDRVGFRVGPHDRTRPLVIDPVLLQSTYLGGSSNDSAYGVAVDDAGNVYVTGLSESTDFPTVSPQQASLVEDAGVRTDAFLAKLNPNGDGFVYSTFLGGKGRDAGHAVAVGVDGSAVIAGYTESPDFPLARPIQSSFGGGPSDAFVARMSPEGAVLQYSTYLGGAGTDTARGVALSQSGDAYVVGSTTSGNFPVAGTPLRGTQSRPDDADAYVTRVNATGSALVYSTYLGGNGEDHALAVGLDPVGNAYVTGDTLSPDLPTVNPFQPGLGGGMPGIGTADADAFVSKLDPNGSSLLYSTYLGGSESDQGASIAVDGTGNAYVTGSTGSTNFPVVRPAQPRKNGDFDAFVAKLSPDGPLFWSTYLGGSASDGGGGVTVDSRGRASVTGAVASTDFPTVKPVQPTKAGGFVDGFVATYDEAGAALTYSSYLGGGEDDQGTSVAADGDGNLHVTGHSNSSDFPTARAFQPAKRGGGGDIFVTKVGEPVAAPEAQGAPSSPARDRRIRFLLGTTIVLLLAAIGQTLWLRRRPPVGPPAPAGVGDLAVTRVEPDWYAANRPPPPRLRDITPVGPRPVPTPAPPPRRPRPTPAPAADEPRPGEVVVPDLLPEGDEGVWSPGPEPGTAEAEALQESTAAPPPDEEPPPAPPPIDVAAPDLWGPSEPDPVLADDSVWWELLGADPNEAGSFPPPPSPPASGPATTADQPAPAVPREVDAAAIDGAVADALAAEGASAPDVPVVDRGPGEAAARAPTETEPPSTPTPGDAAAVEPAAPPAPTEVEVEIDASAFPAPADDEAVAVGGAEEEADDWTAALWGPSGPPPLEPASELPKPDVPEPDVPEPDRDPSSASSEGQEPGDLSISDLLAEDLPIPEAEEQALSIRDLLAEDLALPEGEGSPSDEVPTTDAPPPDAGSAATEAPPAPTEAESPPLPAQQPADAEAPVPPADESQEIEADGPEEENEPPTSRPSRPLPEAAPGRSLGGRLRRAWPGHGRES